MVENPSNEEGRRPIERDPRVDPQPGDMLRRNGATVEVHCANDSELIYTFDGPAREMGDLLIPYVADWRPYWLRWAKDAEVVRTGGDNA